MREVIIKAKEPHEMWDGERVKALRLRYGETQREFAEHFRASVELVKSWEQGKSNVSRMGSVILDDLDAKCPTASTVKAG